MKLCELRTRYQGRNDGTIKAEFKRHSATPRTNSPLAEELGARVLVRAERYRN